MSALPHASSRHGKRVHRLRRGSCSRFEPRRALACRSAVRRRRSGDCRDYLTRARDRTRQASIAVAKTGTRTICNRGLRIRDRDSIPHRQPGCAFGVAVANSILQALSASVILLRSSKSAPKSEQRPASSTSNCADEVLAAKTWSLAGRRRSLRWQQRIAEAI